MTVAWDVVEAWKRLQPVGHRMPVPGPLSLAMGSIAISWGWWDMALLIHLGFVAMLRPAEFVALRLADVFDAPPPARRGSS